MTTVTFLGCILMAVVLGIGTAIVFSFKTRNSASMALTLSIMPAAIALVIMLVNGNVGAGVAVAGAFTAAIFVDMAVGLACGMGYVGLAVLFFAIMAVLVLALTLFRFGERHGNRQLKITIPENLDYNDLFDDLFKKYTSSWELVRVRTTNMGTLYELCYDVVLKDETKTKAFMDEIRCRNGNLNITLGRAIEGATL